MITKYPFWVIKSDAKRLLRGKWNPLVLALFIPFLLFMAIMVKLSILMETMAPTPQLAKYQLYAQIASLGFSVILQLLTVGIYENLKPSREKASFFLVYQVGFQKIWKMIPTILLGTVLPLAISYCLSSELVVRFYDYLMFSVMDVAVYQLVLEILLLATAGLSVYLQYSLLLVPAITVEHPEYNGFRLIRESFGISKGKRFYLFMLTVSFLGWMILGSMAFYIGVLWAILYMFSANYAYYRRLTIPEEPINWV